MDYTKDRKSIDEILEFLKSRRFEGGSYTPEKFEKYLHDYAERLQAALNRDREARANNAAISEPVRNFNRFKDSGEAQAYWDAKRTCYKGILNTYYIDGGVYCSITHWLFDTVKGGGND